MKHFLHLRLVIGTLLAVVALPCFAGEVAVLRNGFEIRHERREVVGSMTRLYMSADGSYVDIPTAEIEHFEAAPTERASGFGPEASAEVKSAQTNSFHSDAGVGCNSTAAASLKSDCGSPKPDLNDVVNAASDRYRLDPDLVNSVIKAESGFNVHARSPKGAQGLMQLMPGTASQLGVPNAFDAEANVEGGTRYLRELLERYNFDLVKALAAYNAGPMRVEQYGGVPPYYETRAYVARIVRDFNKKKVAEKSATAKSSTKKGGTKAPAARTPSSSAQIQKSGFTLASE